MRSAIIASTSRPSTRDGHRVLWGEPKVCLSLHTVDNFTIDWDSSDSFTKLVTPDN